MRRICLLIMCVFLSGCIYSQTPGSQDIEKVLNKRVQFYQEKDRDRFFQVISKDYYPNYKEFSLQVEDFLNNSSNIELEFKIEKILTKEDLKSVEVKWYKTYVDRQGNLSNLEGFATLFFDVSGREPLLINIKGDNPFTQ